MRVTESMVMGRLLDDLQTSFDRLSRKQEELSSGRRINRPSDDPAAVQADLRWRSGMAQLRQFSSNMDEARNWLSLTDQALADAGGLVIRVRQLATQGANGTLPAASQQAMAQEVAQLEQELVGIGNTSLGDRFIFGGTQTGAPPLAITSTAGTNALTNAGNSGAIVRQFAPGVQVAVNVTANQAFVPAFNAMESVRQNLQNGNTAGLSADLQTLSQALDSILAARAEAGAKLARINLAQNRAQSALIDLRQLLASTEDADISRVAVQLNEAQNAYRLALASGARIIQPTLMDFLR